MSNIQIKGTDANTVTLDNVTTIQYQTTSNYDTSSKVLGFGVVVGDNESTSNSKIKLKGDLKQYNWVTSADTSVSNTYAKQAITEALEVAEYQHTINNTTTVNTGIAYLNDKTATIIDERDNKTTIPYVLKNITMSNGLISATGQVYSVAGSSITADSRYDAKTDGVIPYTPSANGYILPTVAFGGSQSESLSFGTTYNTAKGMWEYKLTVDLDTINGGSYAFKFTDLIPQKYGKDLAFTVQDSNGNAVDKSTAITLNELYSNEYTLVALDNLVFDASGEKVAKTVTAQIPFVLYATKTSIEPPEFIENKSATITPYRLVESKGGDWRPAYPVLDGVSVSYWSASEKKTKTVDLTTIYNSGSISSNVWTYTCDDYTLTITGGQVHSGGAKITPVVANSKLYFVSTNQAFKKETTSRDIILTYVFTDKNASTTWNRTKTVNYADLKEYDYNSFKNNGTLTEPSCFAADTLITLADGSQKRIDELTFDDDILVWDFFEGEYTTSKPSLLIDDGVKDYDIINLTFDDSSSLRIIYEHGLFDVDANDYVYINKDNVQEFIGHTFIKNDGRSNTEVKLIDYEITTENIGCYTILTAQYNNCIANGLLTVTPPPIDGFYDYFEIGEGMKYDNALMAEDIEKYGLYTYEDFDDYISYEEFVAFNGAYLKVPVGKGYFTPEDILEQIQVFGVGIFADDAEDSEISPQSDTDESGYIMPLATTEAPATDTVVSENNTITATTYSVSVATAGATESNGKYVFTGNDECTVTLSASGATTGYAMVAFDDDSYYTVQIPNGESIAISVLNAKDVAFTVTPYWGNSADYGILQDSLVASGDAFNFGFYISEIKNGAKGVEAVFVNNTKDDATADFYVAVYYADGKLFDLVGTNQTILSKDDYTYESNITMPEGGYAKAFVWETGKISPWMDVFSTK